MDNTDNIILSILKENSRASASEISKQVNLSVPAVTERIRKLELSGVIEKYTVRANPYALGYNLLAFVIVKVDCSENLEGVQDAIAGLPQVLECHHTAGPGDYLLKVLFRDMQDMENFLSRTLKDIRGVADTNTIICLSTLKEEITV